MNTTVIEPEDRDEGRVDALFRQVMAAVTEQACADGREGDVMEALFPVFLSGVGDDDGDDLGL